MSIRDSSSRRQPTRSVRTSTTRPTNYYARPFSFRASIGNGAEPEPAAAVAPGFFPAITYFTDGLAALPKEVMRHFTLLKETEGKAYQPDMAINELLNRIGQLPPAPRQKLDAPLQAFFGMSMNNSINGSANPSVIDGSIPRSSQTLPDQLQLDEHADQRALLYRDLQMKLREMAMVLDEKNMVLSTANETLARQLARLDTTMPYIEAEISDEARLGSNTHWALPHMKDLRRNMGSGTERSRRDVQAAASLAAAAAAMHENDVAASRSEARREAMLAKRGHRNHTLDSDFDDRTIGRKTQTNKAKKVPEERLDARAQPPQPHKRRRVEKPTPAEVMERHRKEMASARERAQASRDALREAPAGDSRKKRAAPAAAAPRKRNTVNSPSIASSPTRPAHGAGSNRDNSPAGTAMQRVGSSRGRPNIALVAINEQRGRPGSSQSAARTGGDAADVKSTAATAHTPRNQPARLNGDEGGAAMEADAHTEDMTADPSKRGESLKREETEPIDDGTGETEVAAGPAGAGASSVQRSRGGSRASKPPTPVNIPPGAADALAATGMSRSRSTRGINNNGTNQRAEGHESSTKSPAVMAAASPRRSHKKGGNTASAAAVAAAAAAAAVQASRRSSTSSLGEQGLGEGGEMEEEIVEEGEGGDDNEPTYCMCGGVSYGSMVACDNDDCPREWFHLECVGLARVPSKKEKWYCSDECREAARRSSRR